MFKLLSFGSKWQILFWQGLYFSPYRVKLRLSFRDVSVPIKTFFLKNRLDRLNAVFAASRTE